MANAKGDVALPESSREGEVPVEQALALRRSVGVAETRPVFGISSDKTGT
jgi:hypothetical protein